MTFAEAQTKAGVARMKARTAFNKWQAAETNEEAQKAFEAWRAAEAVARQAEAKVNA